VEAAALTELVSRPHDGRVFEQTFESGFADCAPSGRVRLDALARWLQDVAYADVVDAELADRAVWVVRRTRIRVERFPRLGEPCRLVTFCSGLGRMWAERRTSITGLGSENDVEAVSLWVHLDPESWRPAPLTAEEARLYGTSADGRRVTARLRHPQPGGAGNGVGQRSSWVFRATEMDLAGHINNAAYWQPLEEELLGRGEPARVDAEIEFRTPAQPGEKQLLRNDPHRWLVSAEGEVHASILVGRADFSGP
jgi:acyl-ACP thioesterase